MNDTTDIYSVDRPINYYSKRYAFEHSGDLSSIYNVNNLQNRAI